MNDQNHSLRLATVPMAHAPSVTMSSREIADLTGSTHDNVLKTVRKLVKEGVVFGNETPYTHGQNGQTYNEFHLDYRNTMIVVSGYSVELRAKIIDRWMELEQGAQPSSIDYSSPAVMLGVLTHLQSQLGEKDKVIAVQTGKLDRIEGAYGSMCLTDAAKTLKAHPQEFIRLLSSRGFIYKRAGNASWIARQEKIAAGYLEHREHVYIDKDGIERVATRVLVTGKGLVRFADLLNEKVH